MKKLTFLFSALLFALTAFSQGLGANYTGLTVTFISGQTYEVSGNYNDPTGGSAGTDVVVGDQLWTIGLNAGDTCRMMEITSIENAFTGFIVLRVDANGQGAPSTQNSKLIRPTGTRTLPFIPAGGSESLVECISRFFSDRLDEIGGGGTDDQTAAEVPYDNMGTTILGTDVQAGVTQNNALINTNTANIANAAALSGRPLGSVNYSTFPGDILSDDQPAYNLFSEIETALEARGNPYEYYDLGNNAWVMADGPGVTFAKNTTTGEVTITIPGGVEVSNGGWLSPSTDTDSNNDFYLIITYSDTGLDNWNDDIQNTRRPVIEVHNGAGNPSRASPSFKSNTIQTAITSFAGGSAEFLIDDAGSAFPNLYITFFLQ